MANNKQFPEIRFSGFTDAWEQRKLNTFSTYSSSPLTNNDINENGEYDLYDANGVVGKTNKSPNIVNYISIIKDGAGVGRVRKLPKNTSILGTMGAIIPNNSNYDFLYVLLENTEFNKLTSGGTIPHIYFKQYSEELYYIPELSEQQQIGAYFRTLDNLITLHQRECDKLMITKKSMLEKMFPKNNEVVPEIRFSGFTDAWEQRKLSEFVDKAVDNRGKTPPLDENGTHPLIEVAALGGVHPDYTKVEKYLNDNSFENNLRAYIKEGDILFTTVGSIGLVSLMDSREEAAIAQNIVAFRAKENYVPEYLYALFSNEDNQYKATRIVMGAVQPSIKVSQLVDVEYMLTENVEEQTKIGAYFSNLDNLITLHQRELEKLNNIKKSMLEKMFV